MRGQAMRATPDDIVGMTFFARVVEARSFSDAARLLGVSKSAVSARVSRLEERLGVRLLHRTTRRIALTADGVRLYERCARVVAEADEAAAVAAGASAEPRGVLRVYASAGLAQAHLTRAIGAFIDAFADVRVELRLGDRVPDIAVEGFDVAVVVATRLTDSGFTVRKLATSRAIVAAAPAYLRRRGIPFRPQDLVHHECLLHWSLGGEDWRFETEEGAVSVTRSARLAVDDARFLREAALAGLGIAVVPELLVVHDLAAGRLRRVLDGFADLSLGAYALHPHAHLAPASVRAFVEHLVAYFREVARAPALDGGGRSEAPPRVATKTRAAGAPMTAQDVRRLEAVAAIFCETEPAAVEALLAIVARARVVPAARIPRNVVTMSSRVRCRDAHGDDVELTLVYPWDARDGRVSVLTPLGRALLGAASGDTIEASGRTLRVAALLYQPEAAGDHHL